MLGTRFRATAVVAQLSAILPAYANPWTVTATRIVRNNPIDNAGLFEPVGANLASDSYIETVATNRQHCVGRLQGED